MSQRKFTRSQQKAGKVKKETQPKDNHQPMVQALVWYKKEDWNTLRDMFVDADLLPLTYDDWLKRAEAMKTQVQDAGDAVIKVYIDPETFPKWCEDKGLQMDAEARSQLAIEVAQAQSFSV